MLEIAALHKEKLYEAIGKTAFKDRYKYYEFSGWIDLQPEIKTDTWHKLQFVSLDEKGDLIGYFWADVARAGYFIEALGVINFTPLTNIVFAKDLGVFFIMLFRQFGYNKVRWKVAIGNPAEHMYDKVIGHHGGRVVGFYKRDTQLWDGTMADVKLYEILKEEFRV